MNLLTKRNSTNISRPMRFRKLMATSCFSFSVFPIMATNVSLGFTQNSASEKHFNETNNQFHGGRSTFLKTSKLTLTSQISNLDNHLKNSFSSIRQQIDWIKELIDSQRYSVARRSLERLFSSIEKIELDVDIFSNLVQNLSFYDDITDIFWSSRLLEHQVDALKLRSEATELEFRLLQQTS